MSYVVNWLLYPVIFYEVARRRGWLDRYPRYIAAAQLDQPAGRSSSPSSAIAIKMIVPAAIGGILEIALQALFFYWFLVIDAAGARRRLGDGGGAAGGELDPVILPARFIVDRYIGVAGRHLGRSAPPSGRAPAAAPSARRACDRARRARSSTSRLAPLAAADELQGADQDAHLVVQERARADVDADQLAVARRRRAGRAS